MWLGRWSVISSGWTSLGFQSVLASERAEAARREAVRGSICDSPVTTLPHLATTETVVRHKGLTTR